MPLLTQKQTIETAIITAVKKPNLNTLTGKFAVQGLDTLLSAALPPCISHILTDASKGLATDEILYLKPVLPAYLQANIKVPLLQTVLTDAVDAVASTLITALQTKKTLG